MSVCVCVCVCARARPRVCVCVIGVSIAFNNFTVIIMTVAACCLFSWYVNVACLGKVENTNKDADIQPL